MDKALFDCCTHVEVPSMHSILQHLFRTGSTPPGVEMNFPDVHKTDDNFDTDISYRNPALKDLNKQYYAMKNASTDFNQALKDAAALAEEHRSSEQSNVTK